jgi:hypothetical protein
MAESPLETVILRLEQTATELRAGDIDSERAAELVDECARLAAEAGAELDRGVRAGESGLPGQLPLEP